MTLVLDGFSFCERHIAVTQVFFFVPNKISKHGSGLVLVVVVVVVLVVVVGAVDNKAGHYSVSPGRQGWADGQRGGGYTCSGAEGAPTPAPESIQHQCRPRHQRADPRQRMPGSRQAPSLFTVAGRGSGWADLWSWT